MAATPGSLQVMAKSAISGKIESAHFFGNVEDVVFPEGQARRIAAASWFASGTTIGFDPLDDRADAIVRW